MRPTIVAAVDFSDITPRVLETAASEVKLRPGAQLHLIHVVRLPVVVLGGLGPEATVDVSGDLERARTELKDVALAARLNELDVIGHVRTGDALREIQSLAEDTDAELIVVGASGKGLARRAFMGSVSRALIQRAPCSVLVARHKSTPAIEPPRADQDDDIHKRHHPRAHTYLDRRSTGGGSMLTFNLFG